MESEEQINRHIIELLNTSHEETPFTLTFTFNGVEYTTIFKASYGENGYHLNNGCINIKYKEDNPGSPKLHDTLIVANANESRPCFTPRLVSYRNGNPLKITSADVLQTLKTKLSLLMLSAESERSAPAEGGAAADLPKRRPVVELTDGAIKDNIYISKFNLLRGKPAYYEKYGYVSEGLDDIRNDLYTFTYYEFFTEIYLHLNPANGLVLRLSSLLETFVTRNVVKTTPFSTVMTKITWDVEKKEFDDYDARGKESLSTILFDIIVRHLIHKREKPYSIDSLFKFTLDAESAAWQKYNRMLVFTGITVSSGAAPQAEGGAAPPAEGGASHAEGGRRRKRGRTMRKRKFRSKSKRLPSRK